MLKNVFNILEKYINLIIFFLLVLISPWMVVMVSNHSIYFTKQDKLISLNDTYFIDDINTLRGEAVDSSINSKIARIFINKVDFLLISSGEKYFESFDPNFLFFTGDIDIIRGTKAGGSLYLSYLFLFIYYLIFVNDKRNKKYVIIILLLSILPSLLFDSHNSVINKIPFLILFTYIASLGLFSLFKEKRILFILLNLLLVFEILRFYHDFKIHYPERFAEKVWKVMK